MFLSTTDFGDLFFNIFLLAFIPAVSEEFFFRGVFQTLLIKKTKRIFFSIVFTSFIFAFFHLQFFKIIPIFYAGVVLGVLYLWTSSIWVPIFFHFIFNSFQVVIYFFSENKVDFIIETNIGNIRTHMTNDGYFTQGMRQWFYFNGPLVSGDLLKIRSLDDKKSLYQLICDKKKIK